MSIRAPLRWTEWIALTSQQQRLRNLIQIVAYNMQHDRVVENDIIDKYSYYYTLHSSTMSSPFYMSEKLESEHPKWMELDTTEHGTFTGVIIRLWRHNIRTQSDAVISVSGVYFSGLENIGSRLLHVDPALFKGNTIIFYMHGGYFTSPDNFLREKPEYARITTISILVSQSRYSYDINMLSKLHSLQQEIKLETSACDNLRKKISEGGNHPDKYAANRNNSAILRKLMNKPKPSMEHLMSVKRAIEDARFRVQLLKQEKHRKENQVKERHVINDSGKELIDDLGCDLMNKYRTLNKDITRLKERKKLNDERKQIVMNVSAQLLHRRRQLIADLNYIFPIIEMSPVQYTICSVSLPNSEHLGNSTSDTGPAVALGMVVSLIQAISTFLSLPLRYPVVQNSSRSKVIDPVTVDIPDSEREFALFPRGSSYRPQYQYGVYLINKNIAQLRMDCGLSTSDLRPTLANLYSLLNHKRALSVQSRHRSLSGSTLDSSLSPSSPRHGPPSPLYLHKTMSDPIMIRSPKPGAGQSNANSVDSAGSGGGQYEYSPRVSASQHGSVAS